jgi:hypothetical protein
MVELRLLVVLIVLFTIPGLSLLAVADFGFRWSGFQFWCLAIILSISFYPILFYLSRFFFPSVTWGPYKLAFILISLLIIAIWNLRHSWRQILVLSPTEWLAVGILLYTLFTRFYVAVLEPYPAWTDSLHHVLITQVTAVAGQLPYTLDPYFPVPLDQYHLGLYTLSASVQWLAQVPAHTALVWTAQMLNGLCGLGVYLVLDKKVGRLSALVGLVAAGLLIHQPAFYVNWGRFTQLTAQTILLGSWIVTWEVVHLSGKSSNSWLIRLGHLALPAMLISGVFLTHFRVAVFLLPLLTLSVLWELWHGYQQRRFAITFFYTLSISLISLLIILPSLVPALDVYLRASETYQSVEVTAQDIQDYYYFPISTFTEIGASLWIWITAGIGLILGLLTQKRFTLLVLVWIFSLIGIGQAYLLNIPVLNITNLGAVIIMLYLPLSILIGIGANGLSDVLETRIKGGIKPIILVVAVLSGFLIGWNRTTLLDQYRFFMTQEDEVAMAWIRGNTPEDAKFAVNTTFWLRTAPHGTDAGYWLPYFSGRHTTTGMMNSLHGPESHWRWVIESSELVEDLKTSTEPLADLYDKGVKYIYLGAKGDYLGSGLNFELLKADPRVSTIYQSANVRILAISAE